MSLDLNVLLLFKILYYIFYLSLIKLLFIKSAIMIKVNFSFSLLKITFKFFFKNIDIFSTNIIIYYLKYLLKLKIRA